MWYPYLILSVTDPTSPLYVRSDVTSVIIDSGVHKVFHEWGLKEYPGGYQVWIRRMVQLYDSVRRVVKDTWLVVPDYPSDYSNNPISDNVERTIRNIEYALDNYPEVRWVVPVQGRPNSVQSVASTIARLRELGLLRSDYVAIAPTCVTKSVGFLRRLAFTARQLLKGKRIHMFGTTARAWRGISRYIDSTDTIASNFYCLEHLGKRCTTFREHVLGWLAFLSKLLRDGFITREVYEKALQSVRSNTGTREFESIMLLLATSVK
jgi:hypothetical protein